MAEKIAPIAGKHLKQLKTFLGGKTTALLWLFGWEGPQWTKMLQRGNNELLGYQSLLVRILLDRPELAPFPEIPDAKAVYDELVRLDDTLTPREFPVLLGMEPGSKDRLMDPYLPNKPAVNHLLLIIDNELKRLKTDTERKEFVRYLRTMATKEAECRGLDTEKFWKKGGWLRGTTELKASSTQKNKK